jgi:hypothetical protein
MAYIVKLTYVYPADKSPPDQTMRFPMPSEVQSLKDSFINQGKILATDSYFSKDSFSQTNTVVFKSEDEYNEWFLDPRVRKFFEQRDAFFATHGITKFKETTTV